MLGSKPITPFIGAEVTGVDLRRALSADEWRALDELFRRDRLLLLRKQQIAPEEQTRFAAHFGPISTSSHYMRDGDQVMFVSNSVKGGAFGEGELLFHSDHTYLGRPDQRAILLYALEVPSSGGETIFVNACKAYETLPAPLKKRIEGLHALHVSGYGNNRGDKRYSAAATGGGGYRAEHPIAWPHPDTGEKVLFVSQLIVDRIVELPYEEGEALLQELFAHLYDPATTYRHTWEVGDVLFWDNHAVQHARTEFPAGEKRTLRRSPVGQPGVVVEKRGVASGVR